MNGNLPLISNSDFSIAKAIGVSEEEMKLIQKPVLYYLSRFNKKYNTEQKRTDFIEKPFTEIKLTNTQKSYARTILYFFRMYFPQTTINDCGDITFGMIERVNAFAANEKFMNWEQQGDTKNSSLNVYRQILHGFFKFVVETFIDPTSRKPLRTDNPIHVVKISVLKYEEEPYGAYTYDELHDLLEVAKDEHKLLMKILVRTGFRINSVLELTRENYYTIGNHGILWSIQKGDVRWDKEISMKEKEEVEAIFKERDNLFDIKYKTALRAITGRREKGKLISKGYIHKIGISEDDIKRRNLALHSFKRDTVQLTDELTNGDKSAMQEAGCHTDINQTSHYARDKNTPVKGHNLKINLESRVIQESELIEKMFKMEKHDIIKLILESTDTVKTEIMNRI